MLGAVRRRDQAFSLSFPFVSFLSFSTPFSKNCDDVSERLLFFVSLLSLRSKAFQYQLY
jgi:hypothetical protein